jgi:hypothetical protein
MRNCRPRESVPVINRRWFSAGILAVASANLFPLEADGQAKNSASGEPIFGPGPEDLSAAEWEEVRARYNNLLRVYGTRLSADEQHHVLRILTTNQQMLSSIRSFALENGDPSACTLRIYDAQAQTESTSQI